MINRVLILAFVLDIPVIDPVQKKTCIMILDFVVYLSDNS